MNGAIVLVLLTLQNILEKNFNKLKDAFFFDFDGVICDSVNECLITSYNAFHLLKNSHYNTKYHLDDINVNLREIFLKKRFLAVTVKDYFIIWNHEI